VTALRSSVRAIRPLTDADGLALRHLLDSDPYVCAVLAARLDAAAGVSARRLGGDLVGGQDADLPGALGVACFSGGHVLPVGGRDDSWQALGHYLGERRRSCISIIARAEAIETLWPVVARYWGPARLIRSNQPLLALAHGGALRADPEVRAAGAGDLDGYLQASLAMFAEELKLPEFGGQARSSYRARLAELIAVGRAFVRTDRRGRLVFKAEIGAVSRHTCQVQGVWVRPDMRGRGVATAALAAVLAHGLNLAPTVSLYVNDFNLPARAVYQRLGMSQVATLATVMF